MRNAFTSRCFQLAEAWQEVEAARGRSQQLQVQVEDLQEEVSLQEARSHGDASLLSELESSLQAAELGVTTDEVSLHHGLTAVWSSCVSRGSLHYIILL